MTKPSTIYILEQLRPHATCGNTVWDAIVKEAEDGLHSLTKSSQEQVRIAKTRWEKARFGSRSEASRYAANIRWQGANGGAVIGNAPRASAGARTKGAGAPTGGTAKREYNQLTPQQQGQYRARPVGMSHPEAMRRLRDGVPLREREGFRPATADEAKSLGVATRWTDVLVAKSPKGVNGTTVMGIDAKGRPQVLQSTEHKQSASLKKFNRIMELEKHMAKLDARLERDVARGDQHAMVLSLIRKAGVRPGSTSDTGGSVQAFGATTLQARHVTVRGKVITLDFIGKSGKRNLIKIRDQKLADAINSQMAGKKNRDAVFPDVTADSALAYQRGVIPKKFLLKDLRTSLGTKTALDAIRKMTPPTNAKEFKKARSEIGKIVAEKLGNTPSVALSAYINPVVFELWNVQ